MTGTLGELISCALPASLSAPSLRCGFFICSISQYNSTVRMLEKAQNKQRKHRLPQPSADIPISAGGAKSLISESLTEASPSSSNLDLGLDDTGELAVKLAVRIVSQICHISLSMDTIASYEASSHSFVIVLAQKQLIASVLRVKMLEKAPL